MQDIVVGVDPSPTARLAAERAAELAKALGVNLHLVTSVERWSQQVGSGGDAVVVDSLGEAEAFLSSMKVSLGYDQTTTAASFDDPATAIVAEADRIDAGMIVVGNRRVQSAGRVLGSIAGKVMRQAGCDVLVAQTTDVDTD